MAVYFCPKHYFHPSRLSISIKENMRPLAEGSAYRKHYERFSGTILMKIHNCIHY